MTNSLSSENTPASSPQMTWVAIKSISAQVKEGRLGGGRQLDPCDCLTFATLVGYGAWHLFLGDNFFCVGGYFHVRRIIGVLVLNDFPQLPMKTHDN